MSKVVLSHRNFVENLRLKHQLSREDADEIMRTVYSTIYDGLENGHDVRLLNIGTIVLKKTNVRNGYVPTVGRVELPAVTRPRMQFSRTLKEKLADVTPDDEAKQKE